jgi:hypothetical protein
LAEPVERRPGLAVEMPPAGSVDAAVVWSEFITLDPTVAEEQF